MKSILDYTLQVISSKYTLWAVVALLLTACTTVQVPPDLAAMNLRVNQQIVYKADPASVWQTPEETLILGTGDCEDYAILKASYLAPRMTALHIVRVGWQLHAILEVKLTSGPVFLDNRHPYVLTLRQKLDEYGLSLKSAPVEQWLSEYRKIKS